MKNLKKLLAVIIAVALMATMMVPAFAAETELSDVEICELLGMLKGEGQGVTEEYLAKPTYRIQAAIMFLRLQGLEDEALAFKGTENFDDAEEIWEGGRAILAYLKANPELGWQGVGDNKFEPLVTIDAKSYYKVMLEALGYKQGVDFEWSEVLDFAAEIGLVKLADVEELTNADVASATVEALLAKVKDQDITLIEKLVADGVISEEAAIEAGLVAEELAVEAKAVGAKKFQVSFSDAVDTSKATFAVKKGTITINTSKVEWNEAKTVATIELVSKITKGDYTITIGGVELPEGANVITIAAEDEKVAEIEIASDVAPLVQYATTDPNYNKEVLVYYNVKNQYGEDITAGTTLQWTSSVGNVIDNSTGVKKVQLPSGTFVLNQNFTVTALHANTGTFATKVMKVGDYSRVSDIKVGSVFNKDNKVLNTKTLTTDNFYVEIEAYDQYGNKVTNATQLKDQVTVVNTNPSILGNPLTGANPFVNEIPDSAKKTAGYQLQPVRDNNNAVTEGLSGKVTLYFYANITGKQATIEINVEKVSSLDSLVLEVPADLVVKGETVKIPFNAYDQNGVELSETAKAAIPSSVVSCSIQGSTVKFEYNYETNKAELKVTIPDTAYVGTASITAFTPTGKHSQIFIDVKDTAKATTVIGTKDLVVNMTKNATTTIESKNILVADQYGRTMTLNSDWFNKYKIKLESKSPTLVDFNGVSVTEITSTADKITMKGLQTGSSRIVVSIIDKTAADYDPADLTKAIVAGSAYEFTASTVAKSAIAEYKLEVPEVLYHARSHAQPVSVYGLTSSGAKVALLAPVVDASGNITTEGDFVINTNDAGVIYDSNGKLNGTDSLTVGGSIKENTDKVVTVLAVVNADKGPETLTATTTLTNKAPVLTTIYAETVNPVTVKNDIAYINADSNGDVNVAALKLVIKGKDQYGVKMGAANDGDIQTLITNVLITNVPNGVTVTGNGTLTPSISIGSADEYTFKATFITNTSLTKEITVVVRKAATT
ncbi:MAG TPA: hypothetical protein GXX20_12645 [Clostridiaceae bacterium]|nr:hypothetical protein [Clostridiaceae bacterium]